MGGKVFGYARVSNREQNLARQIKALKEQGVEDRCIIVDKDSGKAMNRSGYQALKNTMLQRGDTLVVKSLDRLSRRKIGIRGELQYFRENGIRLKVLDLPTTMIDLPVGKEWAFDIVSSILIEVLGTIAEQVQANIKQRQAEGIAAARERGAELGRPKAQKPANWDAVIAEWKEGKITAKQAMEQTGTKRAPFYKLLKKE